MQEGASTGFAEGLVRHEFRAVPAIDEAWRSLVGIAQEMMVIDFEVVPIITHSTTEYLKLLPSPVFSLRSEEHTSELQSLMRISYAVFCLKKKKEPKTQSKI